MITKEKINKPLLSIPWLKTSILVLLSVGIIMALSSCSTYLKHGDALYDTTENLLLSQKDADARIKKELNNKNNTFETPLIMENPYLISPMTALIIFNTENETPIEMVINGKEPVSFESSSVHALPVYGLYDDFENEITITDIDGNSTSLTINIPKYEGSVMEVTRSDIKPSNKFYLVSPDYARTSAYDETGRLLWYLTTQDNEGALIFLGGDRFLISDPYQGVGGIRINYSGFMEMDYLGKIHKLYVGEYGYHHEIESIRNDREFLIPGQDEDSPYMQAVVYSVDKDSMGITDMIDFYEIFHDINPSWTDSFVEDGKFNFVINGADYDEETGDVLVSVRSFGMIIRINLKTKEIKWIFADPNNVPQELTRYMLKPTDSTRYPYGQHAATFLPNNRIAYHNNDCTFLDADLSSLSYRDRYSSSEILLVDEENYTVSTEWTFDDNKKYISRMSGSLEFIEDNHKLISYGSAFDKSAYEPSKDLLITDSRYTEALMKELDQDDNTIWEATFPSIIHKVYKSTFYGTENTSEAKIPNYIVTDFTLVDGQDPEKHLGEEYDVASIKSKLSGAKKLEGTFWVKINRALLACEYEEEDEIKILFVNEAGDGRLFTYKNSGEMPPIVNSEQYGIRINGLSGQWKAYVSISDTWYDTGKIFDFDI